MINYTERTCPKCGKGPLIEIESTNQSTKSVSTKCQSCGFVINNKLVTDSKSGKKSFLG